MRFQPVLLWAVSLVVCTSALADEEKYTFHESLKPNDVITGELTTEDKEDMATTYDGKTNVDNSVTRHAWKFKETVLEAKSGSATKTKVKVTEGSIDATRESPKADETVTPCPFIREDVIVQRHLDEAVTDDFSGKASEEDTNYLHELLTPDQEWFPDKPIAVGESWDVSAMAAKESELTKDDTAKADCRLDWVKMIDGRKTAQVSSTAKMTKHLSGHAQQVIDAKVTLLIDVAQGLIIQSDQSVKNTYSTPADEAARISGTSEITFHSTAKKTPPEAAVP